MLTKQIFRSEIRKILLEYMVRGRVRPGQRLSLPDIAEELEVSVTPIREALTQLTETGLVTYIANRGFFVTELSQQEAEEAYEAISLLEVQALREAPPGATEVNSLKRINTAFSQAASVEARLELDRQFHQQLTAGYTNQYIKKLIADIRIRIFMYESEFMEHASVKESARQHTELLAALSAGDMNKAVSVLKENWQSSVSYIVQNIPAS